MSEKTSTFVVTEADEASAVLRDVTDEQIHTLSENPEDLTAGTVVEGTVTPEPPMEVTYSLDVDETRTVAIERVDLAVTRKSLAEAPAEPGDLTQYERAGEGEVHVLSVPAGGADEAAEDVLTDDGTLERAARLVAVRVEVRTAEPDDADVGVVSVRYLPK